MFMLLCGDIFLAPNLGTKSGPIIGTERESFGHVLCALIVFEP